MTLANDCPIGILIVSHNKPGLLLEAVQSVLDQSLANWQGILIDSGILYDRGFFAGVPWAADPRLAIVRSPETPALRRQKAMAPWCFNECFRRGWVRGELVMYLCDDDILYPHAFQTFVEAFERNPAAMAMYASQDIGWIGSDGREEIVGERRARAPGGKCCNGRIMDCQVDYLQLCHRRSALAALPAGEHWPEDKATQDHADGIFMERLGCFFEILPLDVKVGCNRRTPWSLNAPAGPGFTAWEQPVHETIMDTWTMVRRQVEGGASQERLQTAVTEFQSQLRALCELEQAQRRRLDSARYRLVDRLHGLVSRGLGRLSRTRQRQAA
jgi:spore maturation protein CgeD